MSLYLSSDQCTYVANFLAGIVGQRRLDGQPVPVKVSISQGHMTVVARPDNSLVTCIAARIPTESSDGGFVVAGPKLVNILRRASKKPSVGMEVHNTVVSIGGWETPLLEDFSIPQVSSPPQVVDRVEFLRGLSTVKWAVSRDLIRPRLTLVRASNGFMRACDGMRYCECRIGTDIEWDTSGFLITLLERYFDHGEPHIYLSQDGSHQLYSSGAIYLYAPRPAIDYLDLDAIVAEPARNHNNFILRAARSELIDALKDVSVMADTNSLVKFDIFRDKIVLSTRNGMDRAEVVVPCLWDGEHRSLNFFIQPLLQFARVTTSEQLTIRLGTSTLKSQTSAVVWEDGVFCLVNQARVGT